MAIEIWASEESSVFMRCCGMVLTDLNTGGDVRRMDYENDIVRRERVCVVWVWESWKYVDGAVMVFWRVMLVVFRKWNA